MDTEDELVQARKNTGRSDYDFVPYEDLAEEISDEYAREIAQPGGTV